MLHRIWMYPLALISLVGLLNIDISGQTQADQQLISVTPFFAKFKIFYALSALLLLSGLVEKSINKQLNNSNIFSAVICISSLLFLAVGRKYEPNDISTVPYSYFDYFKIIFFGVIYFSLYLQLFFKGNKYKEN